MQSCGGISLVSGSSYVSRHLDWQVSITPQDHALLIPHGVKRIIALPAICQLPPPQDTPIFHPPDLVRESLDEVAVMHHRQHRSLESGKGLLELRPAGNVQVVDRFVQQQAVATFRDQLASSKRVR